MHPLRPAAAAVGWALGGPRSDRVLARGGLGAEKRSALDRPFFGAGVGGCVERTPRALLDGAQGARVQVSGGC